VRDAFTVKKWDILRENVHKTTEDAEDHIVDREGAEKDMIEEGKAADMTNMIGITFN
jgi:hypothetical protein